MTMRSSHKLRENRFGAPRDITALADFNCNSILQLKLCGPKADANHDDVYIRGKYY